jgi:hypothetical protein
MEMRRGVRQFHPWPDLYLANETGEASGSLL